MLKVKLTIKNKNPTTTTTRKIIAKEIIKTTTKIYGLIFEI